MKTIEDLRKHIKKCLRYKKPYNFLGFVENQDISPEVEHLFTHPNNPNLYDWVNGNYKLQAIVEEEENKKGLTNLQKLYRKIGIFDYEAHC